MSAGRDQTFPPEEGPGITHLTFFSWLQHVGSSALTRDQMWATCPGSSVLATGLPGKSLTLLFVKKDMLITEE